MSSRSVSEPILGRRRMLHVLGAGSSGVALVACGGRVGNAVDDGTPSDPDPLFVPVDAAGVESATGCAGTDFGETNLFEPGKYRILGTGRSAVIIGHDDGGLFAMQGSCSHAGCKLQQRTMPSPQWYCSCHNGQFELTGEVIQVPRSRPLVHYALSVCDGRVLVDTATLVEPSTRAQP
jgi:nitrite reductase/ring-hydroxylating ferredoxin subunit